ncbi:hypothetical protein BU17DRAFT_99245 [Hysterangium stoloniferum]|nr:hypothetical protein BU17DRAFT_99245 [Hysterangium stoloniferum]
MSDENFKRIHAHFWGQSRVNIVEIAGKSYSTVDITFVEVPQNSRPADILLVREEYILAYNTILADTLKEGRRRSAFLVTGHPGIGKSLFLLYLLFRRLEEQEPVALQIDADEFVLFSMNGVSLHSGKASSAYDIPKGAWALSDSWGELLGPCNAFRTPRAHVIHTSSPSSRRWKEWKKQLSADMYIMDIWLLEELQTLFIISGLDVKDGVALSEKYGPNPRVIIDILIKPGMEKRYLVDVQDGANTLASQFASDFSDLQKLDFSSGISSKIFTARPKNLTSRRQHSLYIPTPFLARTLGEAVSGQAVAQQHEFFVILSGHPSLRSAAGWLFESYAHTLLSNPMRAPLKGYLRNDSKPYFIPAPGKIISGATPLKTIQPPFDFYWRPRESNFKGIDALICSGDVVWALQFTISASHSFGTIGFDEVYKIMNYKKIVKWCLVIVGPERCEAEYARDRQVLKGRWKDKDVQVYACELPLGKFVENEKQLLQANLNEASKTYPVNRTVDSDVPMNEP